MTKLDNISEEERKIILARREYQKIWREANRDRVAEHNRRFYEKQAQKQQNACYTAAESEEQNEH